MARVLLAVAAVVSASLVADAAPRAALRVAEPARALCDAAIERIERHLQAPQGLGRAIALTEAGRRDPATGLYVPWPWTVNNGGEGSYFETKEEAIAHVRRLRREGRTNIDVGCMQINLSWHAEAFESIEEAFDPVANVGYALEFLERLKDESGSWEKAIQFYHSREPERGAAYRERVYAKWDKPGDGKAASPSIATASRPLPPKVAVVDDALLRTLNRMAARATWRWLRPEAEPPAKPTAPLVLAGLPLMPAGVVTLPTPLAERPSARGERMPGPTIFAGPLQAAPGQIPGFFVMPRRSGSAPPS